MKGLNRYGTDVRTTLDLVAQVLWQLRPEGGTPLRVVTTSDELLQDLEDRLSGHFTITDEATVTTIYLLGLEESRPGMTPAIAGDEVIVAFRNRLSHKSLLYPGYSTLGFPHLEQRMRATFASVQATGIMAPQRLGWTAAATVARRMGRHDYGYYLQDRALLSPLHRDWSRFFCPLGVIVGSGRS